MGKRSSAKRLSRRVARLEGQREIVGHSLMEALKVIEALRPEGLGGLSNQERQRVDSVLLRLRVVAQTYDPSRRPDCLILP